LPDDLIPALPGSDLPAVIDFQADFLPNMERILGVVSGNGDGLAIYEAVQLQRGTQVDNLLQNLLHFAVSKRIVPQTVNIPVIVIQDVRPVFDQILFSGIGDNILLPAFVGEDFNQCVFKCAFFGKGHNYSSPPRSAVLYNRYPS